MGKNFDFGISAIVNLTEFILILASLECVEIFLY